jgi:hypothetical protein
MNLFFLKLVIQIPPETFTAWNGLALAHYAGSSAKLALIG